MTLKGPLIILSTSLITGFGRFKTSNKSKTLFAAPGVLLNRNDKIAYLLASPSIALCKT